MTQVTRFRGSTRGGEAGGDTGQPGVKDGGAGGGLMSSLALPTSAAHSRGMRNTAAGREGP